MLPGVKLTVEDKAEPSLRERFPDPSNLPWVPVHQETVKSRTELIDKGK